MDYTDVLVKPVLSEKSTAFSELKKPKYIFWVNVNANKAEIKKAVQQYFNVTPVNVQVMKVFGKLKRVRRDYGRTATRKKAIVTLKHGDKIDLYEGQK